MHKYLNRVLTLLLRRRKPNVDRDGQKALDNFALHLAQEWGNDWLKPIQGRLGRSFPTLYVETKSLLSQKGGYRALSDLRL